MEKNKEILEHNQKLTNAWEIIEWGMIEKEYWSENFAEERVKLQEEGEHLFIKYSKDKEEVEKHMENINDLKITNKLLGKKKIYIPEPMAINKIIEYLFKTRNLNKKDNVKNYLNRLSKNEEEIKEREYFYNLLLDASYVKLLEEEKIKSLELNNLQIKEIEDFCLSIFKIEKQNYLNKIKQKEFNINKEMINNIDLIKEKIEKPFEIKNPFQTFHNSLIKEEDVLSLNNQKKHPQTK